MVEPMERRTRMLENAVEISVTLSVSWDVPGRREWLQRSKVYTGLPKIGRNYQSNVS